MTMCPDCEGTGVERDVYAHLVRTPCRTCCGHFYAERAAKKEKP